MNIRTFVFLFALVACPFCCYPQDGVPWQNQLILLQYAPRYFGPNAFPVPELRNGSIGSRIEAEVRGEYHYYRGDRAKDIFARLLIPVAGGRAGLELSGVVYEYYETAPETVEERHAAGTSWETGAAGDFIVSSFFRLTDGSRIAAVMFEAGFKTASGTRLADARYTDAAAYWFDLNVGRKLYESADKHCHVSMQGLLGFYCWMTNDIVHRQNDAIVYSGGISARLWNISPAIDVAGFYGYENNGDRPVQIRTKLDYEYRKNIFSLRFKHGMKDNLYDSYSLAYIRCF